MSRIIDAVVLTRYDNISQFSEDLKNTIERLQSLGYDVEIQYSTTCSESSDIFYSALVIGRAKQY